MITPISSSIQCGTSAPPPCEGLQQRLLDKLHAIVRQKHGSVSSRKLGEMSAYFTSVDHNRLPITPIERLCQTFAYVKMSESALQLAEHVLELAFEQHLENPEQFNSHGFDHSINVAERTQEVLDQNPALLEATMERYQMSESEARFIHDLLALVHDAGYPHLGCRGKSSHGIDGGDLVSLIGPLISEVVSLPGFDEERLFFDFREAVQLHSADKIDQRFECRLHTSEGVYLADVENLPKIFAQWINGGEGVLEAPRFLREIELPNEELIPEILDLLQDTFKIYQIDEPLPVLTVADELFCGRRADLVVRKDGLLGLPFTEVDLLVQPLQGMIRLTDNMDMTASRLSPIQIHPVFRAIWTALGDDSTVGIENQRLEKLKEGDPQEELAKSLAVLPQIAVQLSDAERGVKTPAEACLALKRGLIRHLLALPENQGLMQETVDKIWQIGMEQSSYDLRHFGGSLAIDKVELTPLGVIVTMNREIYEEMNRYPDVVEGGESIPIGDYHVWRAKGAYASLRIGGERIQVTVCV